MSNKEESLGHVSHLECLNCGEKYTLQRLIKEQGSILVNICYDMCMGPLDVKYDYEGICSILTQEEISKRPDTFWKLKELLPANEINVASDRPFTPLVESKEIGKKLGIRLYFKLDCNNLPTSSFKDRPVALAFNRAIESGYDTVYVASTGNLAIATAFQAMECGFKIHAYVPNSLGKIKKDAIRKYLPHGTFNELDLSYDDCNILSMKECDAHNEASGKKHCFVPNNSFRPFYKEGSKTSGFEIAFQLQKKGISGEAHVFYPLGSGALFCSAYKGFNELGMLGLSNLKPRMWGIQPEQCSPIIDAIGKEDIVPVKNPKTIAKSIAIGKPGSGHQSLDVMAKSNGGGFKVSEKEILENNLDLYFSEGIFCQFVGGTVMAGIKKAVKEGKIKKGEVVVANITGTGKGRIEDDLLEISEEFGYKEKAEQLLKEVGAW
ncbi:pyridoxal-phosphate dependent enzyme [Candidatus Woesearchaeota archaeon]|nr:pyridoxal-phosphate dependent enzyme [Candidatus Woesearchaeota archaeon]